MGRPPPGRSPARPAAPGAPGKWEAVAPGWGVAAPLPIGTECFSRSRWCPPRPPKSARDVPHALDLTAEEREKLAARRVTLAEGQVKRLVTSGGRLSGVELATGRVVPRDAIFVAPRMVPNDALLRDLGCAIGDNGWIVVDPTGRTSHPGVWAVGNVTDQRAQVITAASLGSVAAIAINHDLLEEETEQAVADYQAAGAAPVPLVH